MSTIFIHPTNGRLHREDLVDVFLDAEVIEPDDADEVPDVLGSNDEPTVLLTNNDSFRHAYLEELDEGD